MSGTPDFKDHFSAQAAAYARSRPVYPSSLFAHLASLPRNRGAAWDCGTGNGQAALSLAPHFRAVLATDASAGQVSQAARAPGVLFAAAAAERAPLRDASVDLVAVAQALHWFDFPAFFAEAERVAGPGAVFAAWCYGNSKVSPGIDAAYRALYDDLVGPYWPPERAHVEDGYRSIPMPFPAIECPAFSMEARWTLEEYLAYLGTWSAVRYYREEKGADPVALVRGPMAEAWGNPAQARTVIWPLTVKAGRIRP